MESAIFLGQLSIGLLMGLATIGSAIGIGLTGSAAAGAWGREAREGKSLNFTYIILTGMPLSQTIYAFVLMLVGLQPNIVEDQQMLTEHPGLLLGIGIGGGLAQLASAWFQGRIGAGAVRALAEGENKGFAFHIITMGIAETVGLFGFVFLLLMIP